MTEQIEKARFFGMCIGCEVVVQTDVECYGTNFGISNLKTDGRFACCVQYDENNSRVLEPHGYCKLILKPLSSITDEHAIECAKIAQDINFTAKDISRFDSHLVVGTSFYHFYLWFDIEDDDSIVSFEVEGEPAAFRQFEVIDFLRSKSYCLPFAGKDPIAENWAIEPAK